jgi:hypothetical protein
MVENAQSELTLIWSGVVQEAESGGWSLKDCEIYLLGSGGLQLHTLHGRLTRDQNQAPGIFAALLRGQQKALFST